MIRRRNISGAGSQAQQREAGRFLSAVGTLCQIAATESLKILWLQCNVINNTKYTKKVCEVSPSPVFVAPSFN